MSEIGKKSPRRIRLIHFAVEVIATIHFRLYRVSLNLCLPAARNRNSDTVLFVQEVVKAVFAYTTRSIFNADRLTFAVHFVKGVFAERGGVALFPEKEWEFFMSGATEASSQGAPTPAWVPQLLQPKYLALEAALPELVEKAQLKVCNQLFFFVADKSLRSPGKLCTFII